MTAWQREAWEARLADARLHPGVVTTALALAAVADADGVAVPGLAGLATVSRCSVSTAHQRISRLVAVGLLERDGKAVVKPGGPMRRYRLIDAIPDVGQRLPGGAWS